MSSSSNSVDSCRSGRSEGVRGDESGASTSGNSSSSSSSSSSDRRGPGGNSPGEESRSPAPTPVVRIPRLPGSWDPLYTQGDYIGLEGYGWVKSDIGRFFSEFDTEEALVSAANRITLTEGMPRGRVCQLGHCAGSMSPGGAEHVFMTYPSEADPFFYMYVCLFKDLHVRLPFDDFTMGVLQSLSLAPTQLHPNGWAFVQAFRALCRFLGVEASVGLFLHFFDARPSGGWVSLVRNPIIHLIKPFTASYKGFKTGFFKVYPVGEGRQIMMPDGPDGPTPCFPFSWSKGPGKFDYIPLDRLSALEQLDASLLYSLPRDIPARPLVHLLVSKQPEDDLNGMFCSTQCLFSSKFDLFIFPFLLQLFLNRWTDRTSKLL